MVTKAIVRRVEAIEPHPNADRLELTILAEVSTTTPFSDQSPTTTVHSYPRVSIVTGQHYRVGMLGVYLPTGLVIPGYLAEDLWLIGRASANIWTLIDTKNMRGVLSPGLFAGSEYQPDRKHPFKPWPYWREHWIEGEDVTAYLGARGWA